MLRDGLLVENKVVNTLTPNAMRWEDHFTAYCDFIRNNGHSLVPSNFKTDDGLNLGKWLVSQRQNVKNQLMKEDRLNRLQAVGFIENSKAAGYERFLYLFVKYHERAGHAMVPIDYVTDDGDKLGEWVHRQRRNYATKKLDPSKFDKLTKVGFIFDAHEASWEIYFSDLVTFKEKNGHLSVPKNFIGASGKNLYVWCTKQRARKLSPERIARLRAVGFDFDPLQTTWDDFLDQLRAYISAHGNTEVPHKYISDDGRRLGEWLASNRRLAREGMLSSERRAQLEALGVSVGVLDNKKSILRRHDRTWNQFLEALIDFYSTHQHFNVKCGTGGPDGKDLGEWVYKQRYFIRLGKLSQNRMDALNAVGFA